MTPDHLMIPDNTMIPDHTMIPQARRHKCGSTTGQDTSH